MIILLTKARAAIATPAQAEAGNYRKRPVAWKGLTLKVENEAGSMRRGKDRDGKEWATKMPYAYGYVARSEGVDGDEVDVYLGPDLNGAGTVYVVHQRKKGAPDAVEWKGYDEDKVMLGFPDEDAARAAYLKCYDDPRFLGPITAMPVPEFVSKVKATKERPAMIKCIVLLSKSHISAYTKTDGTFVAAHEDKRKAASRDASGRANVPGMDDAKNVAGKQAPTPAGDVETGGKKFISFRSDESEDYLDAVKERAEQSGKRVLFHVSPDKSISAIEGSGGQKADFGGLFALDDYTPGQQDHYGKYLHEITIDEDARIASEDDVRDLLDSGDYDNFLKPYSDDESDINDLRDIVADGASRFIGDDDAASLLSSEPNDAQWTAQTVRAKIAKDAGFAGLVEEDGILIFPGDDVSVKISRVQPDKTATELNEQSTSAGSDEKKGLEKSLPKMILFAKAHVGPYLRNGRLVNLAGYQGRGESARAADGQASLFGDEHGEVTPVKPASRETDSAHAEGDKWVMPIKDAIAEHAELVAALKSPGKADDREALKEQTGELGQMKAAGLSVASRKRVKVDMEGTHTAVSLSNGNTHRLQRLNSTESMGLPGWHDIDAKHGGYLGDSEEAAIAALIEREGKRQALPAPSKAQQTRARRQAVLDVLGEGWKSQAGVDGARDAYKKVVALPGGGRRQLIIMPERTVDGNFYVGSYNVGGLRPGAGSNGSAKTLEEAKALAEKFGGAQVMAKSVLFVFAGAKAQMRST